VQYPDATPLRHARADYFRKNAFGEDGGYGQPWVKLKLGPVPIWFPNTAGRRRAVRLHDLHHVATGYDTSLVGEAEIGAWELAMGCANYYAAWLLNAGAVAMGLFLHRVDSGAPSCGAAPARICTGLDSMSGGWTRQ